MISYAPACDPQTIRSDLLSALDVYTGAHLRCEAADREYRLADEALSAIKTVLAGEIAADKQYSNETLRKAALQELLGRRCQSYLDAYTAADAERRAAQAELERAETYVKTMRAVLYFDAEAMRLQAEQIAANRMAAQMEHVGGPGDSDDDLPF